MLHHAIQSADIAMAGMVDLLRYPGPGSRSGSTAYLAETVEARCRSYARSASLDANGKWLLFVVCRRHRLHSNSDRALLHLSSGHTGKRAPHQRATAVAAGPDRSHDHACRSASTRQDGSFGGVLTAAIESDYFNRFYRTFQLGPDGSISLLRDDGVVLIRWPASDQSYRSFRAPSCFQGILKQNSVGYYKIISPFDGIEKYIGYEKTPHYPMVVTVAMSEEWMLSDWRKTLRTDVDRCRAFCCA